MDDMMAADEAGDNCFESGNYVVKDGDDDMEAVEDAVHKVRKYDLTITYDDYHHTPRLWFLGYSEEGQLLTQKEMFEDIMAEYANKTVTIEEHPKLPTQ